MKRIRTFIFRMMFNLYPPYAGAGIRVKEIGAGGNNILVELKRRFWNRNYVGTHFGGSLYAMCDPFYMIILMRMLGRGYVVWAKSASIRFKKAVKTTVYARFSITDEQLSLIRGEADRLGKFEYTLTVEVKDSKNNIIAEVDKLLYIRRK